VRCRSGVASCEFAELLSVDAVPNLEREGGGDEMVSRLSLENRRRESRQGACGELRAFELDVMVGPSSHLIGRLLRSGAGLVPQARTSAAGGAAGEGDEWVRVSFISGV
jgi:hypothetical protein